VIESSDPSVAGIYVRVLAEGEATAPWIPSFREAEVPAPRPPAVVVSPVIVRPVHIPRTPVAPPPVVEAPRPEPVVARPEPVQETPLPEVVAVVPEPAKPFVAALPQPGEQIAHFDGPPAPPPEAVVERAVKRDRSKRSTIVMAIPPPGESLAEEPGRPPAGAVKAVGEIDTGSRKVKTKQDEMQSASIMVESEPEPAPPAEEHHEEAKQEELRLEELGAARPLPAARGRAGARRRRNTTTR
jgi:hypothetical protein